MLDAIDEVIAALREVGIEAFLAYGTLLGAVRDGKVIGNDSDADLGYVSHLTHPVDVIRESFRIQRALIAHGYRITRYSALAFKVDVEEADGTVRGLDVFGGFLMDGHLHLMGEIREPFEESWIFPLGTTTLEGRTFPAPGRPRPAAHRDVRRLVAGARPGLPLRAAGHDGAPPQRLVPRPARGPGHAGTGSTRGCSRGCPSPSPFVPGSRSIERSARRRTSTSAAAAARTSSAWRARRAVARAGLPAALVRRGGAADRGRTAVADVLALQPARDAPGAAGSARPSRAAPGPHVVAARHLVDTARARRASGCGGCAG